MAEVPEVYRASQAQFGEDNIPERIDLSGVKRSDSSALALLVDWQARARARGRRIEFANPPQSLLVLARLSESDRLLGWNTANGEDQQ